jgi:hypothetical protein
MRKITAITLGRGPCFGTCPIYEVTLRNRGWASWPGEAFVDRVGDYRGKVDLYDFEQLRRFIARCGFFDWNAEYANLGITDQPNYVVTVRRGTETKTVSQYGTDEPPDFWVVAALVDAIAETVRWAPVP